EEMVSAFWGLPHDPVALTAVALACLAGLQGRMADSEAWQRRAIERAEGISLPQGPFTLAFLSLYLAWLQMILGDPAGTFRYGRQAIEIAEQELAASPYADRIHWLDPGESATLSV
ncbi:tetratricopeptide repeat protein, partial [Lacticaseibacillus rhamnosus]